MAINFGPYAPNNMINPYIGGSYTVNPLPFQNQTQPQVQPGNLIIGIQGLEAAKAYPIGPNTRAYMFDTEKDFLYIKETKADGFPVGPIKIIKCTEMTEEELTAKPKEIEVKEALVLPQNVITAENIDDYISDYLAANNFRPYIPRNERRSQNEQRVLEVSSDKSN